MRTLPRVFARPLELRRGQLLSEQQLVDRLNDLGYSARPQATQPGEFTVGDKWLILVARGGNAVGRSIRVAFNPEGAGPGAANARGPARIVERGREDRGVGTRPGGVRHARARRSSRPSSRRTGRNAAACRCSSSRATWCRRCSPSRTGGSTNTPASIRSASSGAIVTNLRGNKPYLVGASTITQQLVKNFFLTPEKSIQRKLQEQFLSVVLETRASKDEILELYLNEVYLGQRGSFAIHGVAEASRLFFGKDVTNVSLAEAATIAGVDPGAVHALAVQLAQPRPRPPQRRAAGHGGRRVREAGGRGARRAGAAADGGAGARHRGAVLRRPARPDAGRRLPRPARQHAAGRRLHDARPPPAAHRAGSRPAGLVQIDAQLARRKVTGEAAGGADRHRSADGRDPGLRRRPLVQPVAVQPRLQRQAPARLGLQAVRLPRRIRGGRRRRAAPTSRRPPSSSTNRRRSPSRTRSGRRATTRTSTTASSRCAARSPCRAMSRRRRWPRWSASTRSPTSGRSSGSARRRGRTRRSRWACSKRRRSRWRRAYTVFPELRRAAVPAADTPHRQRRQARPGRRRAAAPDRPQPDTTFLVTNMMRSVINEGTGASARGLGLHAGRWRQDRARPTTCAMPGSSGSRPSC